MRSILVGQYLQKMNISGNDNNTLFISFLILNFFFIHFHFKGYALVLQIQITQRRLQKMGMLENPIQYQQNALNIIIFDQKYHHTLMGRIQSKGKGKGISSTVTPFKRRSAKWVSHTPKTIAELIVTMAKKGMSPSQIGVAIRDKEAVPSIKLLTGQKIARLLKKHGCAPEIPEDIYCLIKKAVNIRRHLEKCRKDKDAKYRMILIESRIHRLARYYRRTQKLPNKWKYNAKTASAMVSA